MTRIGVLAVNLYMAFALICLFIPGITQAADYYVDQNNPAASDKNPGTSNAPWLSLYPASSAKLQPGDRVLVRQGVYKTAAGKNQLDALINPRYSGKSGKPIIFKSSPAFAATIEGSRELLSPVQITGQSHISIEGFKIVNPGQNGILIKGTGQRDVEGIAIRNNIIIQQQSVNSSEFINGIYVEYAKNTVIENNRISYENKLGQRAGESAILLDNVKRQWIEYNEIENISNGISIQNNAIETTIGKNIIVNTRQSIQASGGSNSEIRKLKIANNVFTSSDVAISFSPEGGIIRKSAVNNNVFDDYSVAAMQIVQPGMGKIEIWNNIFKRGKADKSFIADIFSFDDPPLSIARMDYNLFSAEPLFVTGLYSTNRRLNGLEVWQKFAEQDTHSVVKAIEFNDAVKRDFRLAKKYRKVLRGRTDGKPSSRRAEVGAYTTAIAQIGITRPRVEQPAVTKQASTATISQQKSADSSTDNKVVKQPTIKADNKPAKKPAQVAMVKKSEDQAKPAVKVKHQQLEWAVDRQLQFGGKCVLESNKVDFFDGYDNTGLKFRVLNNQLYLLTKSNIDMSFNDVGVQVGSNELLHADNVERDQNVVLSKEMPKFLTQLRKSNTARVQLRFWPSYPATRAYSEVVTLDGFLPAYQAYKDCQRGN